MLEQINLWKVLLKNIFCKSANDISKCLEEAYELALSGRKGPVCIEIPINIQSAKISDKIIENSEINTYNTKL